jgi:CcmD family protein
MKKTKTQTTTHATARIVGILVALVAAVVPLFGAGLALAQGEGKGDYEPVTAAAAQAARTDPSPYLLAAYGFIWVVVLLYVISVARGLAQTRAEVADLRRRVEQGR